MKPIFSKAEEHPKKWGKELWINNDSDYCGKLLCFNKDAKFSMHFHMKKKETWFILKGYFELRYIDTNNAEEFSVNLLENDVITIPRGLPHQLIAKENSIIIEVSTQHFEDDSYRVAKGDSQLSS